MFATQEIEISGADDALTLLSHCLSFLKTQPAEALEAKELKSQLRQLASAQTQIDVTNNHLVGELDSRGTTNVEDGMKTATWLAQETKIKKVRARQQVHAAKQLRQTFTLFGDAWARGTVNTDHVASLVRLSNPRVEEGLVESQNVLLGLIPFSNSVEAWERHVRYIIRAIDADGSYNPSEDRERDYLQVTKSFDGRYRLDGDCAGIDGAFIMQSIQEETDRIFKLHKTDREVTADLPIPSHGALRMEALTNLLRRARNVLPNGDRAPRAQADLKLLIKASKSDEAFTSDGNYISKEQTAMLQCDAIFTPVIMRSIGPNGEGVPLFLGRSERFTTPELRMALEIRDGWCAFPACDALASWCDVHHIAEWERDQGLTDPSNCILLCRRHHGVTHRNGWETEIFRLPHREGNDSPDPSDIWVRWTTPSGQILTSQRHGLQPLAPLQLDEDYIVRTKWTKDLCSGSKILFSNPTHPNAEQTWSRHDSKKFFAQKALPRPRHWPEKLEPLRPSPRPAELSPQWTHRKFARASGPTS